MLLRAVLVLGLQDVGTPCLWATPGQRMLHMASGVSGWGKAATCQAEGSARCHQGHSVHSLSSPPALSLPTSM